MLRRLKKNIPKRTTRYVPPPTLPITSPPPIPWPEPTSTGQGSRRPPSPQFHATLKTFSETQFPPEEPEPPKQVKEPKSNPPDPNQKEGYKPKS